MKRYKGFTLIELLIVVAIIAILAAIAVPNFLEAQVRSKVSRVRADIRSIMTAIEAYATDHNKYPADHVLQPIVVGGDKVTSEGFVPNRLSTPIAYITKARIPDPFVDTGIQAVSSQPPEYHSYYTTIWYQSVSHSVDSALGETVPEYENEDPPCQTTPSSIKIAAGWGTPGIDWFSRYGAYKIGSLGPDRNYTGGLPLYDPTNGTVSPGDIYRTQAKAEGGY